MAIALTIGTVTFEQFEIPSRFPIAWKQSTAVNEFPGGTRTIYPLGSFPKPMKWQGWLTGANAFSRMATLARLDATGLEVELAYGPWAWLGVVTDFEADVEHQFKISYTIEFEPSVDLSGVGVVAPPAATAEQLLSGTLSALDAVEESASGLALPSTLTAPTAAVDTAVSTGLLQANGVVAAMTAASVAAIAAASASVVIAAAPLIAGIDATEASPAIDAAAYSIGVAAITAQPNGAGRQLQGVVNPNLFMLAAQYLGDAALWLSIATASGISPPDPLPTGIYTLTIPG